MNIDFLHILADAGANFTIKNKHDWTPLNYALDCKGDFMECICGSERTDAVINFLQSIKHKQAINKHIKLLMLLKKRK